MKWQWWKSSRVLDTEQASSNHYWTTDIHSHLLPGIDDGSVSLENSLAMIGRFAALGYRKLITTPHIMSDFYRNTPAIIREKLAEVRQALTAHNIPIELEAAAEYYYDEFFWQKLKNGEELLTFGKNYLLFETSFLNKPPQLFEIIFELQSLGYKPVYAHPERYEYLYDNFALLEKIHSKGVILQVNLNSLVGYYGKLAQEFAEKMLEAEMIQMLGSDCHNERHLDALQKARHQKILAKLSHLKLLNDTL